MHRLDLMYLISAFLSSYLLMLLVILFVLLMSVSTTAWIIYVVDGDLIQNSDIDLCTWLFGIP